MVTEQIEEEFSKLMKKVFKRELTSEQAGFLVLRLIALYKLVPELKSMDVKDF